MSWVLIKTKEICVGVVGDNEKLKKIVLGRNEKDLKGYAEGENKISVLPPLLNDVKKNLIDYLFGAKIDFPPYPLQIDLSLFTQKVLAEVRKIPYGQVKSYKYLAQKIKTKAYRAVGRSLSVNPFPIIIPCHRVIRTNGELGGFSAGIDLKKKLLKLEGISI